MALEVATRGRIRYRGFLDSNEAMSCSSVHFITTIKDGVVVKILNIDSHGKPSFRFKEIDAICDTEGANIIIEIPQPMGGKTAKRGYGFHEVNDDGIFDAKGIGYAKNGDHKENCNDLGFDEMTLKELKATCKKKRKVLKSVVSTKLEGKNELLVDNISTKWNLSHVQVKEEESEPEEPLSCWRTRLSKNSKVERKRKVKRASSSSPDSMATEEVRSEPESSLVSGAAAMTSEPVMHLYPMQETVNICQLNKVKSESIDAEFWYCGLVDSSTAVIENHSPRNESSLEPPEKVDGSGIETGESISFIKKIDGCGFSSAELPGEADRSNLEKGESTFIENPLHCQSSKSLAQYLEHRDSTFCPGTAEDTSRVTLKMGSSAMVNHEPPVSLAPELEMETVLDHPCSAGSTEAIPLNGNLSYETSNNPESSHPPEILLETNSNKNGLMHDISSDDSLRCMETDDGWFFNPEKNDFGNVVNKISMEGDMRTDNSNEDMATDNSDHSTFDSGALNTPYPNSLPCFTVAESLQSLDGSSSMTEELLCSATTEETVPPIVVELGDCCMDVCALNAGEGLKETQVIEKYHPPENLLSTRKAISPTSQEKLRQAVVAEGLCDNVQLLKHGKRLCFDEWTKDKTSAAGEVLEESKVNPGSNGTTKKLKNGSPSKGILKSKDISCVISCTGKESSLIHQHAEKAIAFSQRQMRDIECLATKLIKGLKSMKNMVDDALLSRECPSSLPKYTADEIRMAADDTMKLEETTRKWLSMMGKDCSRFCKIMKLKEKNTPTKVSGGHKERRKVVFADEIGGTLCHVKVLEDQTAPHVVIEMEGP